MICIILTAGLLALSMSAFAQGASQPASAAKKALVAKVVTLQQPGVGLPIEEIDRRIVAIEKPHVVHRGVGIEHLAGEAGQHRVEGHRERAVGHDEHEDRGNGSVMPHVVQPLAEVRDHLAKRHHVAPRFGSHPAHEGEREEREDGRERVGAGDADRRKQGRGEQRTDGA